MFRVTVIMEPRTAIDSVSLDLAYLLEGMNENGIAPSAEVSFTMDTHDLGEVNDFLIDFSDRAQVRTQIVSVIRVEKK